MCVVEVQDYLGNNVSFSWDSKLGMVLQDGGFSGGPSISPDTGRAGGGPRVKPMSQHYHVFFTYCHQGQDG